jgi:hypothetical protein
MQSDIRASSPQFHSVYTPASSHSFRPEPICLLKIELDGENVEEIRVFEGDDPRAIVHKFGNQFNLSENAKEALLEQIEQQIRMDQESI